MQTTVEAAPGPRLLVPGEESGAGGLVDHYGGGWDSWHSGDRRKWLQIVSCHKVRTCTWLEGQAFTVLGVFL